MFHVKPQPSSGWRGVIGLYSIGPNAVTATRETAPIDLLSALLAFATGLVQASLAPVLATADLRLNLILAATVAVTVLFGLGAGATWAFVGGLTANLLTTDAVGTIPLGLLAVVGLVTLAGRAIGRHGAWLALLGGVLGSLVLDATGLAVLLWESTTAAPDFGGLLRVMVPSALLNGALAAGLYLAARSVSGRLGYVPSLV
jgi:hypothetical protein